MSIILAGLEPSVSCERHDILIEKETTQPAGTLILSIDVKAPVQRTSAALASMLDDACGRLLKMLEKRGLSATWAVDEPAHWSFAQQLTSARAPQEIAILAEPDWIGSAAGRTIFTQELGRRVLAARAAELPVSTLVPYESTVDDHLDLLIKHEVTAVRGVVDQDARASRPAQPNALHYGLWEFPGSLTLPGRSRWLPGGGGGWKARRKINRAIAAGEIFHLVLDLTAWAEQGAAAEQTLSKVLQHAEVKRGAGELQMLTLAQLAERLTPVRNNASSRSILRAAG